MEIDTSNVLPDCRTKAAVDRQWSADFACWTVPVFCGNCHIAKGPYVPEGSTFAFWLCHKCELDWAPIAGTMAIPDEVFMKRVGDAQLEKFGRYLSPLEAVEELKDDRGTLTRLAKDRK